MLLRRSSTTPTSPECSVRPCQTSSLYFDIPIQGVSEESEFLSSDEARVCARTGLRIVPGRRQNIFRVSTTLHGPLDPPLRDGEGSPVEEWSRWDTAGGRTIYGASTAEAAFVEVLEYILPDPPRTPLDELFDDVDDTDAATLAGQIAHELPMCGAMPYRSVSQGWRQDRRLYQLELPADGWFVDITALESIAVVDDKRRDFLAAYGISQLTVSELTDSRQEAKPVTTGVAAWVRDSVVLDDGSVPHGIRYPSKWGTNLENWAMWLRRADDGTGPDPVRLVDSNEIGKHTDGFVQAAKQRNFLVY